MIRRAEVLIVPQGMANAAAMAELQRRVGMTLASPRSIRYECGNWHLLVWMDASDYGDGWPGADEAGFSVTEGAWPEPVGMRLVASSGREGATWTIQSDRYGVRPVFHGTDGEGRGVVCTRPEVVAALVGGDVSRRLIAEHLLLDFNLGDHGPFERVHRLRPQERLTHGGAAAVRIEPTTLDTGGARAAGGDWLEETQAKVVEAFRSGAALELSGGADSRLVLAMGLHAGVKPQIALTLGVDGDEDVVIARAISARCGFEHVVLAPKPETNGVEDGLEFVMRSGFGVNAFSYAWFPQMLRTLDRWRTSQIGGGGGECATGWYYSPADALCRLPGMKRVWVQQRLMNRGVGLERVFGGKHARHVTTEITAATMEVIERLGEDCRRQSDEFYVQQRVPNAGGPVLSASACWYEPIQPLLHRAYVEWGRALPLRERANRRRQLRQIHRLVPWLAGLPFSGGRRYTSGARATTRQAIRRLHHVSQHIQRRLTNRKGTPDAGAETTAAILTRNQAVQDALGRLTERGGPALSARGIQAMMREPSLHAQELGTLLTFAWAADALDELSNALTTAREHGGALRKAA